MPKYFDFMICGYYLYFTSHCVIEAMQCCTAGKKYGESFRISGRRSFCCLPKSEENHIPVHDGQTQ